MIHASGPYRCDHVRIRGRATMTNTPPNGAFRGFGAPQSQFAAEVHMDRVAEATGLDPVRIREINALRPGDTTATGQRLGTDCSALEVLRQAVKRTDFKRKRRAYKGSGRGIGLSLFFHGSGFTGAGEVKLASRASLELTERGARVLVGSTEIGQGTKTMLAQIVADGLGIDYEQVDVHDADTAVVPDSGPTVASRTCLIVGRLLQKAAEQMRETLAGLSPKAYLAKHGPLVITTQYEKPETISWDDTAYRGDAYESYGWACDVAEVVIDPVTWQATPTAFTSVHEIGRAIHPVLAMGQIEGGTAQGIGWALLEEVVMRDGRMANSTLTNYIIPTTLDTPPLDIAIVDNPYDRGPYGAKGVGEMPIDGPAPAIVNAIRHAGADIREIPATPERLMVACASR
jgi:CO/xanthine dehydrogenase Mo-binding subunit